MEQTGIGATRGISCPRQDGPGKAATAGITSRPMISKWLDLVPQGGVGLEVVAKWPADDRVEPDVVGDRDRVVPSCLGSLDDLAQFTSQSMETSS